MPLTEAQKGMYTFGDVTKYFEMASTTTKDIYKSGLLTIVHKQIPLPPDQQPKLVPGFKMWDEEVRMDYFYEIYWDGQQVAKKCRSIHAVHALVLGMYFGMGLFKR